MKNSNKKTSNLNFLKIIQWPIKVLILTFCLSFLFSSTSEKMMSNASLITCLIIIIVFIAIAVFFDMIALSVTSCQIEPFLAMASRKVKGSKQCIMLIRNASKISTICADIVGDICGILSGTVTAKLILIFSTFNPSLTNHLFAALISSIVAGLTVSLKSLSKHYSITYCKEFVSMIGKILYFFSFNKLSKRKKHKHKKSTKKQTI